MKLTLWDEINAQDCQRKTFNDSESIWVVHPKYKRGRYFIKSLNGNWYWRNTRREESLDVFAKGIILKGYVDGSE